VQPSGLDRTDKAELLKCGDSIIETDLSAILSSQSAVPFVPVKRILRPVAAGRDPTRKSAKADRCVSATFPATDHIVAFGDEIEAPQNLRSGETLRETDHEGLDVCLVIVRPL